MMKEGVRLTGMARVSRLLVALTLLLGHLVPLATAVAQETDDGPTALLAEVPTTGASRPGPIVPSSTGIDRPDRRLEGFAPIELQIDTLGLNGPIEIGTIVDGVMQDPSGPWVVAWYDELGKAAAGDNVVMAGHVDYWSVGPAIFWDVPNLVPGDVIRVIGEEDQVIEYAVEWSRMYDVATELTPEVIQNDIVGDTGQESLTLITCGGEFDPATGQYLQRWIVRANQV